MTAPSELWSHAWRMLGRATVDKKHAFSTPVVGTVSRQHAGAPASNYLPQLRTVILRKVDVGNRTLTAYTDWRSQKVNQLFNVSNHMAWCFWDERSRVQITCHGPTSVLHNDETAQIYDSLPKHSRKAYATLSSPGSSVSDPTSGLPDEWEELDLDATDYARANFCVLRTEVSQVDLLQLDRVGHRRLRAVYRGEKMNWDFTWVTP